MEKQSYISNDGILYSGVLDDVGKSGHTSQPIFEAFTNALEAINLRTDRPDNGRITIKLYSTKSPMQDDLDFQKLVVEDNGIGFDEDNFNRTILFKDNRKGFNNKGSGRLQLIHFFNKASYTSIYQDKDGFKERSFTLSKSKPFLDKNSIIFHNDTAPSNSTEPLTVLTLETLLDDADRKYFNELNASKLKELITARYMSYFCSHRDKIPVIKIEHFVNGAMIKDEKIESTDVPAYDKETKIKIPYSTASTDGKSVVKTKKTEEFTLRAFKIASDKLEKNAIKLTSKDEIIENVKIKLEVLSPDDSLKGHRYLFLVSSPYIEKMDDDVRGNVHIPSEQEFRKQPRLFTSEAILIEDIQDKTNRSAHSIYKEIQENAKKQEKEVEKLKKMFLINDEAMKHLTIHLNDSEEKILQKVYEAEAKVVAKKDAEIKQVIDELEDMDTSSNEYEETLEQAITKLVKQIPLQNRTALTHYIARRKLVLELFQKILDKKLKIQGSNNRKNEEQLLHNLIFQEADTNPEKSDLWLINEDFIYFKGTSNAMLKDVKIGSKKLLKDDGELTPEEKKFRTSLGEDRFKKKPDVLLFPEEAKVIIIEFKSPDVNVADHLNQINNYATLIRNFSRDEFQFVTFYGYLIGESIDPNDVRAFDSDFQLAYHFDYLFRPVKKVAGLHKREGKDGSLYTEVIKYSTLLDRAIKRNTIFLNKILEPIT